MILMFQKEAIRFITARIVELTRRVIDRVTSGIVIGSIVLIYKIQWKKMLTQIQKTKIFVNNNRFMY